MYRVVNVTFTKEFDATFLTDLPEDKIEDLLDAYQYEIDQEWDAPEWQFSAYDRLKQIKKAKDLPTELSKFDMVIVENEILSAQEGTQEVEDIKKQAQQDLDDLRLKMGLAEVQCKLPGVE